MKPIFAAQVVLTTADVVVRGECDRAPDHAVEVTGR